MVILYSHLVMVRDNLVSVCKASLKHLDNEGMPLGGEMEERVKITVIDRQEWWEGTPAKERWLQLLL